MQAYAQILDALGEPTRRAVLEQLLQGPRAVSEIARAVPVSRPAVSQHLRVLRDAGLVTFSERGTQHLYRIDPRGLAELRAYVEGFWAEALASFKETAERKEDDDAGAQRDRARPGFRQRR